MMSDRAWQFICSSARRGWSFVSGQPKHFGASVGKEVASDTNEDEDNPAVKFSNFSTPKRGVIRKKNGSQSINYQSVTSKFPVLFQQRRANGHLNKPSDALITDFGSSQLETKFQSFLFSPKPIVSCVLGFFPIESVSPNESSRRIGANLGQSRSTPNKTAKKSSSVVVDQQLGVLNYDLPTSSSSSRCELQRGCFGPSSRLNGYQEKVATSPENNISRALPRKFSHPNEDSVIDALDLFDESENLSSPSHKKCRSRQFNSFSEAVANSNVLLAAAHNAQAGQCLRTSDNKKAMYHFEEAIKLGCDKAMFNLAVCYETGVFSSDHSHSDAMKLYRKSHKLGNVQAGLNLAAAQKTVRSTRVKPSNSLVSGHLKTVEHSNKSSAIVQTHLHISRSKLID